MDTKEKLLELINLNKEYIDIIGYNSSEKTKLIKMIDKRRDKIIYELGLTYEFSDKYINLKSLILNEKIRFTKNSKSNINFLKKDFIKLLKVVRQELVDKDIEIKKESIQRFGKIENIDLNNIPSIEDEEVVIAKKILDSSSMVKIRLTFEFLELNPELFVHYSYDSLITDIFYVYSDEIKYNYDLIATFIDMPLVLEELERVIKEF